MRVIWIMNAGGLPLRKGGAAAGGDVRLYEVSRRWDSCYDQLLLTTSGGEQVFRMLGSTMKMQLLPASVFIKYEPFWAFNFYSYCITAINSVLRQSKLPKGDVVITASDYFCCVVPALRIKKRNPQTRWVAWIHHRTKSPKERPGNPIVNRVMYFLQTWSLKKIAQNADVACVIGKDTEDSCSAELIQYGMDSSSIISIQNGMSHKEVPQEEISKCVDAVMVGVRPNKGMYDIVPVWREVNRIRPGTTLRLMGRMSDTSVLEKDIAEAGLSDLITLIKPESGFLDTHEFYKMIKESRVMFAPSYEEGWGIAVCEAMACGLPVVAYDLPVYRKIFGDALLKIPIGDTSSFAQTICRLLSSQTEYDEYRNKGLECSKQYDWDTIAERDKEYLK